MSEHASLVRAEFHRVLDALLDIVEGRRPPRTPRRSTASPAVVAEATDLDRQRARNVLRARGLLPKGGER